MSVPIVCGRIRAPWANFLLYASAIVLLPLCLVSHSWLFLTCVPCMIVIQHGCHEAIHGTLSPLRAKWINNLAGWLGFAVLGQNLILMRWSHITHHRYGRLDADLTIDQSAAAESRIHYYLCLLGASNVYHEVAGYIYPLFEPHFNILTRRFEPRYFHNWHYIVGQIFVLVVNIELWMVGGWKWLCCKLVFTLYWGAIQNVAHFGLKTGYYPGSRIASRTYRFPGIVDFILFRAGSHHLEHHLFPHVPGPRLDDSRIAEALRSRLGRSAAIRGGLVAYIKDVLAQYKGPHRSSEEQELWTSVAQAADHSYERQGI